MLYVYLVIIIIMVNGPAKNKAQYVKHLAKNLPSLIYFFAY